MIQKIQAFLAALERLSKREKTVFYSTVAVVSVMAFDRLFLSPVFDKLRSLDKKIRETEATIKKNMHIVALQEKITAESAKYSSLASGLEMGEEEATSILKEIETIANKSSVYLVDLKPGELKNVGTSKKYTANLNCEAQMEQVVDFMYNIESSPLLLTIEKYQISPKEKDSSIARCSMSVSKVLMK